MFNILIITLILFLQISPNFFLEKLPDDMQWQLYIAILHVEVVILSLIYYKQFNYSDKTTRYAKIGSLIIMLIALFDFLHYTAITYIDNYYTYVINAW